MLSLGDKLNLFSNIDYKLDALMKRMDKIEDGLSAMDKKLNENEILKNPWIVEFTSRGVLSTLKNIEEKIDKLQTGTKGSAQKQDGDDVKGKLTIKCNTPPIVEETLKDIASKVDLMFDNVSKKEDIFDQFLESGDYIDDQEDVSSEIREERKDFSILRKLITRMQKPCKDSNEHLVEIKKTLSILEKTIIGYLKDELQVIENNSKNNWLFTEESIKNIEASLKHINNYLNVSGDFQILTFTNFTENFSNIERRLSNTFDKTCHLDKNATKIKENVTDVLEVITLYSKPNLQNCDDLETSSESGIYEFGVYQDVNPLRRNFNERYCESNENGIWTIIQRRGSNASKITDFNQNWEKYKYGFGPLDYDFWFGNEFLHRLSLENELKLRIELEDFTGNLVWAEYDSFLIYSEEQNYKLLLGEYIGNASDSFSSHNNTMFSTFDRKNDRAPECCPCATSYGGGWWFNR